MDPAQIIGLLRRRWIAILLCLLAGIGGAELVTRQTEPVYRATSRVIIDIPPSRTGNEALGQVQVATQLLRTYSRIATTRSAAAQVKVRLNLPESTGVVQGKLTAQAESETLLMSIAARDNDPERAASIADAATAVFVDTVDKLQEGNVSPIKAQVIDRAVPNRTPISPRPRVNLILGTLLGLAIGLAAALTIDALDRTVKLPAQAAESFHAPLLGLVPRIREIGESPIVTADDPSHVASESYRALRTAVRFIDPDSPLRSILVTSPSASEGKTTTAVNLAIALAQAGERVVLVDADLRRASLGALLGIETELGVTSVVTHRVSPTEALQGWRDTLAVMASGPLPPNPSEILGSQTMAALLTALSDIADVVVIDAPPVLPVTDAVVLATQVDGVLLVARQGKTHRSAATEARRRLDGVGANVVGAVLNQVSGAGATGYYETYYS